MATRVLPPYLPADWPAYAPIPSPEEWARAVAEDGAVEVALAKARQHPAAETFKPETPAE